MKTKIELTADEMMNVVDALCDEAVDRGYDVVDDDEIFNDLIAIVDAALSAMGIEYDVADEDFDDEEDEENEEEEMESIIYDCDGHRGISASDARLLMQCVAKVMQKQFDFLPKEAVDFLIQKETLRITEEWGIEVVDTRDE